VSGARDFRDDPELAAALALLQRAERELPSERSADAFSEAFELLDDYLAGAPPPAAAGFVANLKFAHARRLLLRLREVDPRQSGQWLHYLALLLIKLEPELQALTAEHPELGRLLDECLRRHGAQLAGIKRKPGLNDG